jgi:hypothetical protein
MLAQCAANHWAVAVRHVFLYKIGGSISRQTRELMVIMGRLRLFGEARLESLTQLHPIPPLLVREPASQRERHGGMISRRLASKRRGLWRLGHRRRASSAMFTSRMLPPGEQRMNTFHRVASRFLIFDVGRKPLEIAGAFIWFLQGGHENFHGIELQHQHHR